ADHDRQTDARQAARGQGRTQAPAAPPNPRTRAMARERRAWALRLLRRARQQRRDQRVLQPGHPPLVPGAAAPEPAHPAELDTHATPQRPMATTPETDAPLPQRALRRQNPR